VPGIQYFDSTRPGKVAVALPRLGLLTVLIALAIRLHFAVEVRLSVGNLDI